MAFNIDIAGIDRDLQLADLDRVDAEESLYVFLKSAWRYIDPAHWKDAWCVQAICEHLQAVVDGDIKRLIINCPPRIGKPVSCDAWIPTLERGLIRLEDLFVGLHVLTHAGRFRKVLAIYEQGILSTLRISSRSGRTLVAAPDHPFLTPNGWQQLKDLAHQDVVGTVPQYIESGTKTVSLESARLLGYLVGDGHCKGTPNITVADDIEAADIRQCILSVGFLYTDQSYHMASTGYLLHRIAIKANGMPQMRGKTRKGFRGPVRQFMMEHGLYLQNSYTKLIPKCVMEGDNEIVRNFIGAYWACDGYITTKGTKRDGTERDDLMIGCDSVNQEFLQQMQILLLRIGISSLIRQKISKIKTKKQGETYISYSLTISDQDNCWRFGSLIEIRHTKGEKLEKARRRRFDFDHVIRGEVVESIFPSGDVKCRCLTVEEDESFVANGFAVHNSNTVSVAFPAWTWAQHNSTPTCGPGVQFLYASYADKLSLRDSVKCRRLIESPWYQARWGNRFQLTTDQNTKSRFTNDKGGDRLITSIGAGVTGEGGNIICIDDPNAANDVESEATTEATITWWTTAMPTRLNDPEMGAFIIIQQRLGEDDLTGHILEHEADGWTHLCLPGRYEPERSFHTSIGWKDPRTEPGELLWPERFSEPYLKRLEKSMGPFTFAGQIQQRPEPKGGGIIKNEWWIKWEPEGYPKNVDFVLGVVDTAFTEADYNDPSGMMIWMIYSEDRPHGSTRILDVYGESIRPDTTYSEFAPKVLLAYAWDERLELHDLVVKVANTCIKFKVDLLVIENKASGISVAQEIRRLYNRERFGVELFDPKSQDKMARLYSVQHIFAEKIVSAPDRTWADRVIKQVGQFPKGKHDEYVDLTSMGLRKLRDMGLLVRQSEREADLESQKIYPGRNEEPLYSV